MPATVALSTTNCGNGRSNCERCTVVPFNVSAWQQSREGIRHLLRQIVVRRIVAHWRRREYCPGIGFRSRRIGMFCECEPT